MGNGGRRWVRAAMAVVAILTVGLVGSCKATPPAVIETAVIDVDSPTALVDAPVRIRVSGLGAGREATLSAHARDYMGRDWRAEATYRADAAGVVDVSRDAPVQGVYAGVDAMGLFWSMNTADVPPVQAAFSPPFPYRSASYEVRLALRVAGRTVAERTLTRTWLADGVSRRRLELASDKMIGDLYLPPAAVDRHQSVLLLGGSTGGEGPTFGAALLASHGYRTLALAYFGLPVLPATLTDIPLEYFESAARLLAAQAGARPAAVAVIGYSRGTEPALLLAENFPDVVAGAVVYAPSDRVVGAFPGFGDAWTLHGAPVPQGPICLAHVAGPVLAIAGGDDQLWAAAPSARAISASLAGSAYEHRALVYPEAGHNVGTYPNLASGTQLLHQVNGETYELGGTRAGDAAAKADGWPTVLDFLAAVPTGPRNPRRAATC